MKEDPPLFLICPLTMLREKQLRCTEEECAIWDDYGKGQCSLMKFFNSVGYISSALRKFVDRN